MTKSPILCGCGHLNRLKFLGVECPRCRIEAKCFGYSKWRTWWLTAKSTWRHVKWLRARIKDLNSV